jgi:hypothetical protein
MPSFKKRLYDKYFTTGRFILNSTYIIYVKQGIFNVQLSIISNNIYFLL